MSLLLDILGALTGADGAKSKSWGEGIFKDLNNQSSPRFNPDMFNTISDILKKPESEQRWIYASGKESGF